MESGLCTEDQVLEGVADELGLPFVAVGPKSFDQKAVELIPREFVEKHTVLPLFRVRDVLTVAVSEPTDVFLLDRLAEVARKAAADRGEDGGLRVQVAVATARNIRRTVQTYLPDRNVFVIDELLDDAAGDAVQLVETEIEELGSELTGEDLSPIVKTRQPAVLPGGAGRRERPARRAGRRPVAGAVPRGRRAGGEEPAARPRRPGGGEPGEDHGGPRHLRAPAAAGRADSSPHRGPHDRPAGLHPARHARGERGRAGVGPAGGLAGPGQARLQRRRADPPAAGTGASRTGSSW